MEECKQLHGEDATRAFMMVAHRMVAEVSNASSLLHLSHDIEGDDFVVNQR